MSSEDRQFHLDKNRKLWTAYGEMAGWSSSSLLTHVKMDRLFNAQLAARQLDVPTLFLLAEKDEMAGCDTEVTRAVAQELPEGEIVVIEKAIHQQVIDTQNVIEGQAFSVQALDVVCDFFQRRFGGSRVPTAA